MNDALVWVTCAVQLKLAAATLLDLKRGRRAQREVRHVCEELVFYLELIVTCMARGQL